MLFGKRLKKRFIGLAGLLVLGVTVHFLDEQRPQSFDLFSELPESPSEPDYYTVNSTFHEYGPEGIISRSIHSDRLVHYPDSETATLEAPELIAYSASGQPLWQALADSGLVEGDGSHFQLNQNVIVWQLADTAEVQPALSGKIPPEGSLQDSVRMRLTTEQLNLDMDKEHASTGLPVRIDTPEGTTHAVGMFSDLNSRQLQLKSQVRGTYAPRASADKQPETTR